MGSAEAFAVEDIRTGRAAGPTDGCLVETGGDDSETLWPSLRLYFEPKDFWH
jgi:hypothetical protein